MRGFFFTMVTLLALGWQASNIELPRAWSGSAAATPASHRDASTSWRRTAQGWEKPADWRLPGQSPTAVRQPMVIHPVAIATLQGVVAIVALGIAEQAPGRRQPPAC